MGMDLNQFSCSQRHEIIRPIGEWKEFLGCLTRNAEEPVIGEYPAEESSDRLETY